MVFNRNAVVADFMRDGGMAATALRLEIICGRWTQGSSCLATLGFGTECRWDSGWPRAGCAGTPPRPGWFFLDKIFSGRKVKVVKRKNTRFFMRFFFVYLAFCQIALGDTTETYFLGPASNQSKASNVISLQTGETLRWVSGSGAVNANYGTFSYSVSYTNSPFSYAGTTSFSEGTILATGPCAVTFSIASQQGGTTNAYSYTVLRQVAATNSSTFQSIPSTAVVIPSDSGGPVNILLESSPDLINWYPSMPGQYGASYTNRFFRVRAILNN
jgi:hypothetical protein